MPFNIVTFRIISASIVENPVAIDEAGLGMMIEACLVGIMNR